MKTADISFNWFNNHSKVIEQLHTSMTYIQNKATPLQLADEGRWQFAENEKTMCINISKGAK